HMAQNMLRAETSRKASLRKKQQFAGMSSPYLEKVLDAAYSHAWRSLNNIHADHVITSMPITQ
ncbi:hypothetical protein, partial [Aeromonas caviae]|uniref:hypothetical protein n=1 Tax=Aeromonas caviae TaxID=648 RepID=UPI001CC6DD1A